MKHIEVVSGEFTMEVVDSIMKVESKSGGKITVDISKPSPWQYMLEGDLSDVEFHIY